MTPRHESSEHDRRKGAKALFLFGSVLLDVPAVAIAFD
jgi:hypothetical protein